MLSRLALLLSASCLALVVAAGCGSTPKTLSVGSSDVPSLTTTQQQAFPQIAGKLIVSDGSGPVGYIDEAQMRPATLAAANAQNAKTLLPVTLGDGTLVGYIAPEVPFIPLSEADQPGFDVEKIRAQLQGGCEPQIGDPTFKQEFPLCPPPPAADLPHG
jgi:hypothetical protein